MNARARLVGVCCSLLAAAACSDGSLKFPKGFLWAVAVSPHESEGRNTNSDWQVFEDMGRVQPAGWAQNAYELYDTDAANAKSLGLNAFQLGIEWARIVPRKPSDPTAPLTPADIDAKEVAHYHAVLDSLISRGITPIVTVTHFSLPKWVNNPAAWDDTNNRVTDDSLGGWMSEVSAQAMARYAEFLVREYGSKVKWWITIDEPLVVLIAGYMADQFPPGISNLSLTDKKYTGGQTAIDVLKHMISSHARAYHAMKAVNADVKVSFAHNMVDWEPKSIAKANVDAAGRVHSVYNWLFLDALVKGDFDTSLIGQGVMEHHDEWANTIDYIGMNYYDAAWVVDSPGFFSPLDAVPCSPAIKGAIGDDLFLAYGCPAHGPSEPLGMTKMLVAVKDRYGLPILITESGFIDTPEGKSQKVVEILNAVHAGIAQGANVFGYCYWTLNYDYEWNSGWEEDMGLYTFGGAKTLSTLPDGGLGGPVSTSDFTRVPQKPFVDVYQSIATSNSIPRKLLTTYLPDAGS